MGLTQIFDNPPHYARFETRAGSTLSLHEAAAGDVAAGVIVYFEVDDVDATETALKEQGIAFDSEPTDQRWLWREARLRDPPGNRLCIFHAGENRRYPSWRVGNEG